MFLINDDNSIYVTRGDTICFQLSAMKDETSLYKFQPGEVLQLKIFEKKACDRVVLQKDFVVEEEKELVTIYLEEEETKLGDIISKPKDYWYEVTLNPDTAPQTIICYDEDGPKIFRIFPEGADLDELPIEPDSDFERVVKDTVVGWLNNESEVLEEKISQAVEGYLNENPVKPVTDEHITEVLEQYLAQHKSASPARIGEVTLLASKWTGSSNLYSQVVTVDGVTANSQVDLTPSVEQLAVFYEKDLTFVTENANGIVTVYAVGQKPTNDYTIQVTITEVEYE